MRIKSSEEIIEVKEIVNECPICRQKVSAIIDHSAEPRMKGYTCDHFIEFDWSFDDRCWYAIFSDEESE